jgi:hypothetical protein
MAFWSICHQNMCTEVYELHFVGLNVHLLWQLFYTIHYPCVSFKGISIHSNQEHNWNTTSNILMKEISLIICQFKYTLNYIFSTEKVLYSVCIITNYKYKSFITQPYYKNETCEHPLCLNYVHIWYKAKDYISKEHIMCSHLWIWLSVSVNWKIYVQVLEFLIKNLYGYKYCNFVHLCAKEVNSVCSSYYNIEKYAWLLLYCVNKCFRCI